MSVCACPAPAPSTWIAPGRCHRCGEPIVPAEQMVPRDVAAERDLTALAALAAGLTRPGPDGRPVGDTRGLDDFADQRCHPGGVRADLDDEREASEEIADCRNYLVWGLLRLRPGYEAGDAQAGEQYAKRLRALSLVVQAWDALHT